jgi:hypothetical protein
MDDMSIAEAIKLKEKLVPNPDQPRPDPYHARTGHTLPEASSRVYEQLLTLDNYAKKTT